MTIPDVTPLFPGVPRLPGSAIVWLRPIAAFNKERMSESESTAAKQLTRRQIQLLQWIADKGESMAETGMEFGWAPATVKSHLQRIFRILEVNTRAEAIVLAMREGLVR